MSKQKKTKTGNDVADKRENLEGEDMSKKKNCTDKAEAKKTRGRTLPSLISSYRKSNPSSVVLRLLDSGNFGVWKSRVFGTYVVFIRASFSDIEAVVNELGRETYKLNTEGRTLNGMTFEAADKSGSPYHAIAVTGTGNEIIPILAHEAVHAAVKILNSHRIPLGVEVDDESAGEPVAYLAEALVEFGLKLFLPDLKLPQFLSPLETLVYLDSQNSKNKDDRTASLASRSSRRTNHGHNQGKTQDH